MENDKNNYNISDINLNNNKIKDSSISNIASEKFNKSKEKFTDKIEAAKGD